MKNYLSLSRKVKSKRFNRVMGKPIVVWHPGHSGHASRQCNVAEMLNRMTLETDI